jgi:hypothetical protein
VIYSLVGGKEQLLFNLVLVHFSTNYQVLGNFRTKRGYLPYSFGGGKSKIG